MPLRDLIDTLTGWLPSGLEPWAEVLIYLGILGAMSVVPLVMWLGAAARPKPAGG